MVIEDPRELERVDREVRINELKVQVSELTGCQMSTYESEAAPPEVMEHFWQNVVAAESQAWDTDRERLTRVGVTLPEPEKLSDEQIKLKVTEIVTQLAAHRTYIFSTNHLSDRQLYEELYRNALDEAHPQMPPGVDGGWLLDLIGGGSPADNHIYLKYYADERTRRQWKEDWPEDDLPDHEDPPFDRDRHLPQPPGGL